MHDFSSSRCTAVWSIVKRAFAIGVCLALWSSSADAQIRRDSATFWLISANSEFETYLRAQLLTDSTAFGQWQVRAFTPRDLDSLGTILTSHPWGSAVASISSRPRFQLFMPEIAVAYNSGFPFGDNDGALWAGKGLTTAVFGGARATVGAFDVQLAPLIFRAQNAAFPLAPNGRTGPRAYGNFLYGDAIDLPERFGDSPYQRVDAGESHVRLSWVGATGGLSTESEFWGPAVRDPFLLGANAPGFQHLFLGTDGPLTLGPLTIHLRAIAGKLEQSDFSPTDMAGRGRYLSGLVGTASVAFIPGLELGGGRLFQNIYADSTVTLKKVIEPLFHSLLKRQRARALGTAEGDEPDNQLASLFARWAFPSSGFEFYAEYGREDSAFDLRDLILEPDHDASVLLGLQKVWKPSARVLTSFRLEVFNDRLSHLSAVRDQAPAYIHTPITQGHTNRGQVLGAPDGFGGAGQLIAIDQYTPSGRNTIQYTKSVRSQKPIASLAAGADPVDVVHSIKFEQLTFHKHADLVRGITFARDLNREYVSDATNVRLSVGLRAHW